MGSEMCIRDRFAVLKYGVMAANRGGKLKTLVQSAALLMFLLPAPQLAGWETAKWVVMWIAFLLTIVTGIDYLLEARRLRQASLAAGHPIDLTKLPRPSRPWDF